jgi:cytoskeletal protein CcmA (bactofilin family)
MFGRPKTEDSTPRPDNKSAETIIGHSVRVEGNFRGNGDVIVEGEIKGSLKTKKNLQIGKQAQVKAGVEAVNAYVAGQVIGNIKVQEKLELAASATVVGDISARTLSVAPGAQLNGQIKMESVEVKTTEPTPALPTLNDKASQSKKKPPVKKR